jgi:hypothetical protein
MIPNWKMKTKIAGPHEKRLAWICSLDEYALGNLLELARQGAIHEREGTSPDDSMGEKWRAANDALAKYLTYLICSTNE